ncbi:hypothetical protein ACP4OV_019118 [Aristida adscensionis]
MAAAGDTPTTVEVTLRAAGATWLATLRLPTLLSVANLRRRIAHHRRLPAPEEGRLRLILRGNALPSGNDSDAHVILRDGDTLEVAMAPKQPANHPHDDNDEDDEEMKLGECKKLKHDTPECLDTAFSVDSSCVPGGEYAKGDEGEEDDDEDVDEGSAMVEIMKRLLEMQQNCAIQKNVLQGESMFESIKEAMSLTVRCGAAEGTLEHFMATQLFVKAEYRCMFQLMSTDEARLGWLKKWCKYKGYYD